MKIITEIYKEKNNPEDYHVLGSDGVVAINMYGVNRDGSVEYDVIKNGEKVRVKYDGNFYETCKVVTEK